MTSTQIRFDLTNAPAVTGTVVEDFRKAGRRFTDVELADGRIVRLVELASDSYADWKTYLATMAV